MCVFKLCSDADGPSYIITYAYYFFLPTFIDRSHRRAQEMCNALKFKHQMCSVLDSFISRVPNVFAFFVFVVVNIGYSGEKNMMEKKLKYRRRNSQYV